MQFVYYKSFVPSPPTYIPARIIYIDAYNIMLLSAAAQPLRVRVDGGVITVITRRNPECIRRASGPLLVRRRLGGAPLVVAGGWSVRGRGGTHAPPRPNKLRQRRPPGTHRPPFIASPLRVARDRSSSLLVPTSVPLLCASVLRRRRRSDALSLLPSPQRWGIVRARVWHYTTLLSIRITGYCWNRKHFIIIDHPTVGSLGRSEFHHETVVASFLERANRVFTSSDSRKVLWCVDPFYRPPAKLEVSAPYEVLLLLLAVPNVGILYACLTTIAITLHSVFLQYILLV